MSLKNCALAIAAVFLFSASSIMTTAARAGGSIKDSGYTNETVYPFATFSGLEFSEDYYESYFGAVFAFNGDLARDGWILRAMVTGADFEYDYGTEIDGDFWQGDLLVGYQIYRDGVNYYAMAGVDYQEYDLSPDDPSNVLRGDEVGFKVAAGIETERDRESPVYGVVRGSYSTAFDSYYVLGRLGREIRSDMVLGIEGWAYGDDDGDGQRVGAFLLRDVEIGKVVGSFSISGGYQFADEDTYGGNGGEGGYGTIKFVTAFGR